MSDETKQSNALQKVEGITKSIGEIAAKNFAIIEDKCALALVAMSALKSVTTKQEDEYAKKLIIKVNATEKEVVDNLRMAITRPFDELKEALMIPEKKMISEKARIKQMRDAWATSQAQIAKDAADAIEKKKNYALYESEVKKLMAESMGVSIAQKVIDLDNTLALNISAMTLKTVDAIKKQIGGFKPSLKKEFFETLFTVEYDSQKMTEEQFKALQDRARGYWKFDDVNKKYVAECDAIVKKWLDKIPQRVEELNVIAKGGDKAEVIKANIDKRNQEDEAQRQTGNAQVVQNISLAAETEKQEEGLNAEFEAQLGIQEANKIIDGISGRKIVSYRLSPETEKNPMKVAEVISKVILHFLSEPNNKGIFMRDGAGFPRHDTKGNVLYIDGVQDWLDKIAGLGYDISKQVPGLIRTEEISSISKAR